jgi:uroporphyrinogen decarboxylase
MNSLERTLTALGQSEPDRVPVFLLFSHYGARELGMSIENYFSHPDYVTKGQLQLREKYNHDVIYTFTYASLEMEAFGGSTVFYEDGSPNSGEIIIKSMQDIWQLEVPDVPSATGLTRILETTRQLKQAVGDTVPIVGVVMSPFSLPVMQMGFGAYIELMQADEAAFWHLIKQNQAFCIAWANAQLEAGATAICYFDPVSSATIVTPEIYREKGKKIAQETLAAIKGPTATHFASGRSLAILDDVKATGTAIVGVSSDEDLSEVKTTCDQKLTILGNLNGIEMCRWTEAEAIEKTKQAIAKGARGGGFLLAENHGEVPWQVEERTLHTIIETAHQWGTYPLHWVDSDG